MGSSSSSTFPLFIVLITLILASTATATFRVELSNETPVKFDLQCQAGGNSVGPATLAPSATATWDINLFNGFYPDSDCTVHTDNESYHGFFLLFNENTYGTQCMQNGNVCSWHLRPDGCYLLVKGKVFTVRAWTLHPSLL